MAGMSGFAGISVRRNVSARCSTPYYFVNVDGLLVEENIVYRPSESGGGNHGMYINGPANMNTTSRGNVLGGEATTVAFFEAAIEQKKFTFRSELTATRIIDCVRENFAR
jgi:hypothetical protein